MLGRKNEYLRISRERIMLGIKNEYPYRERMIMLSRKNEYLYRERGFCWVERMSIFIEREDYAG